MTEYVLSHLADLAARALQRARGLRSRAHEGPPFEGAPYDLWIEQHDTPDAETVARLRAWVDGLTDPPRVSFVCAVQDSTRAGLQRTLASLRSRIYPHWELHEAADTSALTAATGDVCGFLSPGDTLAPHALACAVHAFLADPDTALVYSDEDAIDEQGRRHAPRFKPDCNLEFLRASPYIGRLALFRCSAVRALESVQPYTGPAHEHDLVLRLVETSGERAIRHIPRVLYHAVDRAPSLGPTDTATVVRKHLERAGVAAEAMQAAGWPEGARVRYALPDRPPRVTLIIPSRNQHTLLRSCVESVLAHTSYPAFDIVVVDNGSDQPETLDYLEELAANPSIVVRRDARPFNWSALNNAAVPQASGSVLCFMNDDIEAFDPDWLTEMVRHASRPDVGVVGARLWYPDDTLQHAGVVLHPYTGTSHVFKRLARGHAGHLGGAVLTRNVSAVTGACMVVRRGVFAEAGGFDETFAVDFNDVDFCLRVRARGYRNLWTPHAQLRHHESATRGPYEGPGNRQRFESAKAMFVDRWAPLVAHDPAFNPNMALTNAEPPLAWPPRVGPLVP